MEEFEQAIVENIYDIAIIPINRSNGTLTAGLLTMFSSNDPVVNPSNRSHPDMIAIFGSLLQPKDTRASTKESLHNRLRTMYDTAVPFAFL